MYEVTIKDMTVIKYLISATQNNYIEKLEFDNITNSRNEITVIVSNEARIRPTLMMIEANMYTKKELLARNVEYLDDRLLIETFNNVVYDIRVKSKN